MANNDDDDDDDALVGLLHNDSSSLANVRETQVVLDLSFVLGHHQ